MARAPNAPRYSADCSFNLLAAADAAAQSRRVHGVVICLDILSASQRDRDFKCIGRRALDLLVERVSFFGGIDRGAEHPSTRLAMIDNHNRGRICIPDLALVSLCAYVGSHLRF